MDLAPILDPLLVPRTTAITIGLRNEPQRPVIDMLCDYLAKKKMLLILDNCEHLVDASAQMADRIMHAASDVQILASSREALGIAGEVTYRVPSLGLPDVDNLPSLETLSQYEAVKLFIDRATAAIPDFKVTNENAPALAQICHRLDGIPLAIELAAGKIRVLGLEQIAKRLDDRFKLLTGGSRTAMERHQTLRATVDWSYNLLPPEEQTLYRRLAVFLGGWTLEAAESVCGDEAGSSSVGSDDVLNILEQLINKSLVITEDKDGTSRYRMLETIRQYANEKLVDSGESEVLREKHLEFFLNLAETAEPHLIRYEQLEWLAQLDADHENLRAALEHALGDESAKPSLRLCAALGMFWFIKGHYLEGTKRLATALKKTANDDDPDEVTARVRALVMDTEIAWNVDDIERLGKSAEMCLELAQKSGAELEVGIATYHLGFYWYANNNFQKSRSLLEHSIKTFQKVNAVYWEAKSTQVLERVFVDLGNKKCDLHFLERTEELARQAGERWHLAWVLGLRSEFMARCGQIQEGEILAKEADMYYRQVGSAFNTSTKTYAAIAWIKGDYERAESLLLEFREQCSLVGEKGQKTISTMWLGQLSLERGDIQKARGYFEEALETSREGGVGFVDNIPLALAWLWNPIFWDGDENKFRELVREGVPLARSLWFSGKINFLTHLLE
ncbi:MAG TPA: hypothetical protein VLA72_12660, partial [Anaerolineales bacterium]|nr:hypothetical protein [Anaerolineales bacterium]